MRFQHWLSDRTLLVGARCLDFINRKRMVKWSEVEWNGMMSEVRRGDQLWLSCCVMRVRVCACARVCACGAFWMVLSCVVLLFFCAAGATNPCHFCRSTTQDSHILNRRTFFLLPSNSTFRVRRSDQWNSTSFYSLSNSKQKGLCPLSRWHLCDFFPA